MNKIKKHHIISGGILIGSIVLAIMGVYLIYMQNEIYSDKAEIVAPQVDLSSQAGGVLQEVFVKPGDQVLENDVVARVDNELLKAKSDGLITAVNDDIGKNFNRGEVIVSMVDPKDLRVVAHLDEDKGLKDVQVGQRVTFTVDAFGSQKYFGTVDEISDTSRDSAVVFSISDKREVKQFDVKIRFDGTAYPELKNGMSAKVWIYKQ